MNPLVAPALGFLGGFFTAIFAEPLRRWIYAPRLEPSFGTSQQFLTKTPEIAGNSQYESLYVRIKVINVRRALAKACRAYLVNVERKGPSGFEPTEYCESLQLAWASQESRSFDAFDLPRDVPH